MTEDRSGCNGIPGGHMATGWWGRDILWRVIAEQEHAKQRALLTDQIKTGGLRVALWRSASSGDECACRKKSNQQADRKCYSCHGTGIVPGYMKFGYNTVWMSPTDSDIVLTDVKVVTDFRSAKVVLNDDAIIGIIESGDKPFNRTAIGSQWEQSIITFIRTVDQSSIIVEYSLDSGMTWSDISNLSTVNPVSGVIRFKAILLRDSVDVLSPLFEIIRARYATIGLNDLQPDGSYRWGPWILVLRNIPKNRYIKTNYGDAPSRTEMSFWTVGLSVFDSSITYGSRGELIKPEDEGPCDFIEFLDGVAVGNRYVIIERQPSDPFGTVILDQNFLARLSETVDPYSLVF